MSILYKANGDSPSHSNAGCGQSASVVTIDPSLNVVIAPHKDRGGGGSGSSVTGGGGFDMADGKDGLKHPLAWFYLLLWYLFSVLTLFMNKSIVDDFHVEANILGASQLLITAAASFVQIYFPCGLYKPAKRKGTPLNPLRDILIVGATRFGTVLFGLVSLKYVTVSFTETVKSSAPLFTVILTRLLFKEVSGLYVQLSLIPIMLGLALCSAYDLSFNTLGFLASLAANISECLQNIYSKSLVSDPDYKYTPAELLCYTSLASIACQAVTLVTLTSKSEFMVLLDTHTFLLLVVNGLFFHFQLITAYALMEYICNITYSVSNTVKRALMIWISIPFFKTSVNLLSGLGTVVITVGVLLYTKARDYDMRSKQLLLKL